MAVPTLPSRYEDLETPFRGRLRPNQSLLTAVKKSYKAMQISKGVRFLPVYGESGSGKTCAAMELGTHLPDSQVILLPRVAIESRDQLKEHIRLAWRDTEAQFLIFVVDQYEEGVAERRKIPTQFVEAVSLLDRDPEFNGQPMLFLWLTTRVEFQRELEEATTRNRRILAEERFELKGPPKGTWPEIVEETFRFHNSDVPLADYQVLENNLIDISRVQSTLGRAIEETGRLLFEHAEGLQDLSNYQVVMLWPVTDGHRITRVQGFTNPRQGYKLDWDAWYRELNKQDRKQLPLAAYNRARLYFDMRLIPIAAADLHPLCRDLEDKKEELHKSYLARFEGTHLVSILKEQWDPDAYSPLRERESERASKARDWYEGVTSSPVQLGRRLARILRALNVDAEHEQTERSPHGTIRADVLVKRPDSRQDKVLLEIKAYSATNTMPSTIRDAIRTTLKRHAQFGGFLGRQ